MVGEGGGWCWMASCCLIGIFEWQRDGRGDGGGWWDMVGFSCVWWVIFRLSIWSVCSAG